MTLMKSLHPLYSLLFCVFFLVVKPKARCLPVGRALLGGKRKPDQEVVTNQKSLQRQLEGGQGEAMYTT